MQKEARLPTVSTIRPIRKGKPGMSLLTLMPFSAMVIGLALAIVILNHYAAAPARRSHELIWGVSFILFAFAAGVEVAAALWGWTEPLARLYYISWTILA